MERKSDKIGSKLVKLRKEIIAAIESVLKDNNIESINVQPYIQEGHITNYAFFDTNRHGEGECLELEAVKFEKGKPSFVMYTNYGDYWGEKKTADFDTSELFYILDMLEEIFEFVEGGEPLLKEDETFDDYEE